MVEQAKVFLNTNSAVKYSTGFLPFLLSVPLFCSIYETSHNYIPAYSPLESPVLLLKVLITILEHHFSNNPILETGNKPI